MRSSGSLEKKIREKIEASDKEVLSNIDEINKRIEELKSYGKDKSDKIFMERKEKINALVIELTKILKQQTLTINLSEERNLNLMKTEIQKTINDPALYKHHGQSKKKKSEDTTPIKILKELNAAIINLEKSKENYEKRNAQLERISIQNPTHERVGNITQYNNSINEFYLNQKTFASSIETLINHFYDQRGNLKNTDELVEEKALSKEDTLLLEYFLEPYQVLVENPFDTKITKKNLNTTYDKMAHINQVFKEMDLQFKAMTECTINYNNFLAFIKKINGFTPSEIKVEDILIKPIQHLPRFVLTLDQIIKYSDPNNVEETNLLMESFLIAEDQAHRSNEIRRDSEKKASEQNIKEISLKTFGQKIRDRQNDIVKTAAEGLKQNIEKFLRKTQSDQSPKDLSMTFAITIDVIKQEASRLKNDKVSITKGNTIKNILLDLSQEISIEGITKYIDTKLKEKTISEDNELGLFLRNLKTNIIQWDKLPEKNETESNVTPTVKTRAKTLGAPKKSDQPQVSTDSFFPGFTRVGHKTGGMNAGKGATGVYKGIIQFKAKKENGDYEYSSKLVKSLIKQDRGQGLSSGLKIDKIIGEAMGGFLLSRIYQQVMHVPSTQFADVRLIRDDGKIISDDTGENTYIQSIYIDGYKDDLWRYAYKEAFKKKYDKENKITLPTNIDEKTKNAREEYVEQEIQKMKRPSGAAFIPGQKYVGYDYESVRQTINAAILDTANPKLLEDFANLAAPRILIGDFGLHNGNFGIAGIANKQGNVENRLVSLDYGAAFLNLVADLNPYSTDPSKTGVKEAYKNHFLEYDKNIIASEQMANAFIKLGNMTKEDIERYATEVMEEEMKGKLGINPYKKFARRMGMKENEYNAITTQLALENKIKAFMIERLNLRKKSLQNLGFGLLVEHCYDSKTKKFDENKLKDLIRDNKGLEEYILDNPKKVDFIFHTDSKNAPIFAIASDMVTREIRLNELRPEYTKIKENIEKVKTSGKDSSNLKNDLGDLLFQLITFVNENTSINNTPLHQEVINKINELSDYINRIEKENAHKRFAEVTTEEKTPSIIHAGKAQYALLNKLKPDEFRKLTEKYPNLRKRENEWLNNTNSKAPFYDIVIGEGENGKVRLAREIESVGMRGKGHGYKPEYVVVKKISYDEEKIEEKAKQIKNDAKIAAKDEDIYRQNHINQNNNVSIANNKKKNTPPNEVKLNAIEKAGDKAASEYKKNELNKLDYAKNESVFHETVLKNNQQLKGLYVPLIAHTDKIEKNKKNNFKKSTIYHFMEYADFGSGKDLCNLINNTKPDLTPDEKEFLLLHITESLLKIMQAFHQNKIFHRDLKAENFLIYNDGKIKLSDFGAAMRLQSDNKMQAVSQLADKKYQAPYYYEDGFDKSFKGSGWAEADSFSLGLALLEFYGADLTSYKTEASKLQESSPVNTSDWKSSLNKLKTQSNSYADWQKDILNVLLYNKGTAEKAYSTFEARKKEFGEKYQSYDIQKIFQKINSNPNLIDQNKTAQDENPKLLNSNTLKSSKINQYQELPIGNTHSSIEAPVTLPKEPAKIEKTDNFIGKSGSSYAEIPVLASQRSTGSIFKKGIVHPPDAHLDTRTTEEILDSCFKKIDDSITLLEDSNKQILLLLEKAKAAEANKQQESRKTPVKTSGVVKEMKNILHTKDNEEKRKRSTTQQSDKQRQNKPNNT